MELGTLVYLASPYTHKSKAIEAARYDAVLYAWRWLLGNKPEYHYFVPIVMSHQLCITGAGLPGDWKFWASFDSAMIGRSQEFWALCITGWKTSVGVTAERQLAAELGLPIRFLVPDLSQDDGYILQDVEP